MEISKVNKIHNKGNKNQTKILLRSFHFDIPIYKFVYTLSIL